MLDPKPNTARSSPQTKSDSELAKRAAAMGEGRVGALNAPKP